MSVRFTNEATVINPPPSPRNSPRISVTPRTRQSGKDSRSPKTHSRGRKRKTKVKKANKSKRGSQKKRGRRASKRQRGGVASTEKCRAALFGCGLKTKLTDTTPLINPAESLSIPYYQYKNGKKELNNIINQFVDDFKNIVNRKDEYNGQNFNIEDTSIINKEGEILKDYLSRKLKVAKKGKMTFSDFIDFLMKGSMGIFLCAQLTEIE